MRMLARSWLATEDGVCLCVPVIIENSDQGSDITIHLLSFIVMNVFCRNGVSSLEKGPSWCCSRLSLVLIILYTKFLQTSPGGHTDEYVLQMWFVYRTRSSNDV